MHPPEIAPVACVVAEVQQVDALAPPSAVGAVRGIEKRCDKLDARQIPDAGDQAEKEHAGRQVAPGGGLRLQQQQPKRQQHEPDPKEEIAERQSGDIRHAVGHQQGDQQGAGQQADPGCAAKALWGPPLQTRQARTQQRPDNHPDRQQHIDRKGPFDQQADPCADAPEQRPAPFCKTLALEQGKQVQHDHGRDKAFDIEHACHAGQHRQKSYDRQCQQRNPGPIKTPAVDKGQPQNHGQPEYILQLSHIGRVAPKRIKWLCEQIKGWRPIVVETQGLQQGMGRNLAQNVGLLQRIEQMTSGVTADQDDILCDPGQAPPDRNRHDQQNDRAVQQRTAARHGMPPRGRIWARLSGG